MLISPRQFRESVTIDGLTRTLLAAALVGWGIARTHQAANDQAPTPSTPQSPRTPDGLLGRTSVVGW
ncbi:hypothetical protein [Streptomyces sp. SID13031]|uniref:hypothetical protein n=1 Tax=Streptomyces sp. SID13031 TaxID=2706046 RepID=UPI0013C897F3|nr:hypothetical protein [Streptomyces sp. SID13031]NEA34948.1 hypothetical protein [Streptomyces sp. SID13031]